MAFSGQHFFRTPAGMGLLPGDHLVNVNVNLAKEHGGARRTMEEEDNWYSKGLMY